MVRFLPLPRGTALLIGGALAGTALILAIILGGDVHLGPGGAPDVRIDAAPEF